MIRRLRHWARGHTRKRRYTPVGVAFHWTVAALVVFQLWWGWRAGQAPVGADKLDAYAVHGHIGLLLLVLTLLRIGWRMMVPGPYNDADKQGLQTVFAHATHYVFYICLLGLPLSGWAMVSATAPDQPLRIAGVIPWPMMPFHDLPPPTRWAVEAASEWVHFGFIVTLLVLIPLHAGAALYHHFVHRHDVLTGMVPGLATLEKRLRAGQPRKPKARRSAPRPAAG